MISHAQPVWMHLDAVVPPEVFRSQIVGTYVPLRLFFNLPVEG